MYEKTDVNVPSTTLGILHRHSTLAKMEVLTHIKVYFYEFHTK